MIFDKIDTSVIQFLLNKDEAKVSEIVGAIYGNLSRNEYHNHDSRIRYRLERLMDMGLVSEVNDDWEPLKYRVSLEDMVCGEALLVFQEHGLAFSIGKILYIHDVKREKQHIIVLENET